MEINEEKRKKFMENAGKRVNNVMHDIQILEPMARSSVYDFTQQDVEEMFTAMQETLNNAKGEFYKKFEEKARSERKVFSFGSKATANVGTVAVSGNTNVAEAAENIETVNGISGAEGTEENSEIITGDVGTVGGTGLDEEISTDVF